MGELNDAIDDKMVGGDMSLKAKSLEIVKNTMKEKHSKRGKRN
jgi:hypothetical protein